MNENRVYIAWCKHLGGWENTRKFSVMMLDFGLLLKQNPPKNEIWEKTFRKRIAISSIGKHSGWRNSFPPCLTTPTKHPKRKLKAAHFIHFFKLHT